MLRFALATLLSLSVASPALAQGVVTGAVTDAEGSRLAGANVVVVSTTIGAATQDDGTYRLTLAAGSYVLAATSVGFEEAERRVTVRDGETVEFDFVLAETPVDIGEVIVQARETLTGRGYLDLPGSAHYIGTEALRQHSYGDVHRALREVPGLNIQEEDGYGLRPNIGIRGTGAERSEKITVMEDGVLMAPAPYAAPAAYYFPTVGRMDGIEVRKGASQVKYGPYTTGGALNLLSAGIPNRWHAEGEALVGRDQARTLHARLGNTFVTGGPVNVGFVAEAYLDNVDGFKTIQGPSGQQVADFNTGFDKNDFLGKLRLATRADAAVYQSLTFTASYTDELSNETYLGLTESDFEATPFARYLGSQVDEMDAEHSSLRLRHVAVFSDRIDLTTTLYRNTFARNWYKLDKVDDGLDDEDGSVGISAILSDPGAFANELAIVQGGFGEGLDAGRLYVKANNREYYSQGVQTVAGLRLGSEAPGALGALLEVGLRVHTDEMDRFQWVDGYAMENGSMTLVDAGTPGTESNRIERGEAVATFAQAEVEAGRFTFTPGLRFEHITLSREDYGKDDVARTGADLSTRENTVDVLIPGLGVGYQATETLNVFAGVHRGFAPPSSKEGVESELSVNYEVGLRYGTGAVAVQAVGFFNDYSNLLGSDLAAAGGQGTVEQFNGGEVNVLGFELAASADLARFAQLGGWGLPARLAYTLTDAEFQNRFDSEFGPWGTVESGDALPYVARHQLTASMGVERGPASLDLRGVYVSAMRTEAGSADIDTVPNTDARFVLDVAADYEVRSGIAVFGRVHNLTDAVYVVARRPAGLRPGLPRTLTLGVRASF